MCVLFCLFFTTHWRADLQTCRRGLSCLTTCRNALNSLFAGDFCNTNNSESEMENFSRWSQSVTAHVHILTQARQTSHMLIFTGLSGGLPLTNPIRETSCVYSSIKSLRKLIQRPRKTCQLHKCCWTVSSDAWASNKIFFQSLICRNNFNSPLSKWAASVTSPHLPSNSLVPSLWTARTSPLNSQTHTVNLFRANIWSNLQFASAPVMSYISYLTDINEEVMRLLRSSLVIYPLYHSSLYKAWVTND